MTPRLAFASLCLLLAACSLPRPGSSQQAQPPAVVVPQVITAIGFGAPPTDRELSPAQKKLAAMRASKLDAYRSLVETLSGVRLSSQGTVGMLALQDDRIRVFIDGYLRGARVVSVREAADGSFTTTLELTLAPSFVATLAGDEQPVAALPQPDASAEPVATVTPQPTPEAPASEANVEVVADRSPTSNFYYAQ